MGQQCGFTWQQGFQFRVGHAAHMRADLLMQDAQRIGDLDDSEDMSAMGDQPGPVARGDHLHLGRTQPGGFYRLSARVRRQRKSHAAVDFLSQWRTG